MYIYFFPLVGIQSLSINPKIFISNVNNPLDQDVELYSLAITIKILALRAGKKRQVMLLKDSCFNKISFSSVILIIVQIPKLRAAQLYFNSCFIY